MKTEFIKPTILDAGRSKHALFYITRHPKGMMIMNNLFVKDSADGKCVNVKELKKSEIAPSLFKKSDIETDDFRKCLLAYQSDLIELLKTQGKVTNKEIILHATIHGWPPKYAKEALNSIKDDLEVKYLRNNKTNGYYISEANWDKDFCEISYKVV